MTDVARQPKDGPLKPSVQISPALKSWLDNVIVPALVKAYVAEIDLKNGIASASALGLESQFKADSSSEGHS
jgi:hypothetical protein